MLEIRTYLIDVVYLCVGIALEGDGNKEGLLINGYSFILIFLLIIKGFIYVKITSYLLL